MRKIALFLGMLGLAAAVFGVPTAQAGTAGSETTINVVKVVAGAPPAGTTFTVQISCPDGTSTTLDFMFGAAGGSQTTPAPGTYSQDCTFTETSNGGAERVEYECNVDDPGGTPPGPAVCNSNTSFTTGLNGEITLTAINYFPDVIAEPEPTPPAVDPDVDTAPDVVAATPTFTG